MFLTIVAFVLVLGLLIFVHELGHFVMAKRAGIKVEEFGFGFPPRVFGVKRGETIYSINLLPLGGFVKIFGENGVDKKDIKESDKGRAFGDKPIKTRAIVLAAGVTMNLILAAFLLGFGNWVGLPTAIGDEEMIGARGAKVQIVQVAFDSPAEKAGIHIGDTVALLKAGGEEIKVDRVIQMQNFIDRHKDKEIIAVIQRGDEVLEKTMLARANPPENEGSLGVALVRTAIVSHPWYKAIYLGIADTFKMTVAIVVALGGLLWQLISTGKTAIEGGGPVYIFNLTGQAAQLGFIYVLQLAAILSINLAIINILPFPALDGGRLLFLAIEKIKGTPVSQNIERIAHTAGFALLILLMIAITWRDIAMLF
ncbi:MAG: site-2 protease family protein [Patescibacteria group bacterium]|nr:site-2 protease family protein [Patescibacteria group bacterium]